MTQQQAVMHKGVNAINTKKSPMKSDRMKMLGLLELFEEELVAEITEEDPFLELMRTAIINKNKQCFNKMEA